MALVSDLMGLGMPGPLAEKLGNVPATLAGATTAQATGTPISSSMAVLTTGSGQTAFTLRPAATITRLFFLFNSSSTTALIFPPVGAGANFNGGSADASISLAQNKAMIIWRFSTTQFMSVLTA